MTSTVTLKFHFWPSSWPCEKKPLLSESEQLIPSNAVVVSFIYIGINDIPTSRRSPAFPALSRFARQKFYIIPGNQLVARALLQLTNGSAIRSPAAKSWVQRPWEWETIATCRRKRLHLCGRFHFTSTYAKTKDVIFIFLITNHTLDDKTLSRKSQQIRGKPRKRTRPRFSEGQRQRDASTHVTAASFIRKTRRSHA